jgi:hypothetical protein
VVGETGGYAEAPDFPENNHFRMFLCRTLLRWQLAATTRGHIFTRRSFAPGS